MVDMTTYNIFCQPKPSNRFFHGDSTSTHSLETSFFSSNSSFFCCVSLGKEFGKGHRGLGFRG